MQFYLMTERNVQRGVATLYIVDDIDITEITYLATYRNEIKILSLDTKKTTKKFMELSSLLDSVTARDAQPILTALTNFSLALLKQTLKDKKG